MHISEAQSGLVAMLPEEFPARRPRSRSLDARNDYRTAELAERMKHTFKYEQNGFKSNTRGNFIHESFITLNDLLSKTPGSMALNIEISKTFTNCPFHTPALTDNSK
jgi:hypothetical protein